MVLSLASFCFIIVMAVSYYDVPVLFDGAVHELH